MRQDSSGFLAAIIHFSLQRRGLVLALAGILIGYGIYSLSQAKYDVFPEFAPPQVVIQTEAVGLSPEQVEVLVTQPIENNLNGMVGIEASRSNSIQGLSVITVVFRPETDIYRARQVVAERLATVAVQLPQGVKPPVMTPLTSSTSAVLVVGLTSPKRSLMELRTLAEWMVKPHLLAVPGVAKVAVFGGETKQLQVQIRPERLIQCGLSLEDVLNAARRATGVRGAGFIDNANQRLVLQSEGQSLSVEQLSRTVILHHNGISVTLGEVAKVIEGQEPLIGAATINGQPGVQLVISEQYGSNTLDVTEKLDQALAELGPALEKEGVELRKDLFRPANFIQTATSNVLSSLLVGAILVVLMFLLFLSDVRTAAISCTAMPLSLIAAGMALDYLGFSFNTMTLGGLAIAIGEVVDDAVIDVENIQRRLKENSHRVHPVSRFRVVLNASYEMRGGVVYATLAMVLIFVPILTLSGLAGRLFAPLGIAYIVAILASLLVALTVTPALCLLLLGKKDLPAHEQPVSAWVKGRYLAILTQVERHPRKVAGGVIGMTLAALAALPFFGGGFLPELREGHYIVHMATVPGTSLQESLRLGQQVTEALQKLPYVRSVAQRAGRAEKADDVLGTHYSEFNVDLKPLEGEEAEWAQGEIRKALVQFPGANFAVKTFLTERVEETLSGYTASVVVNIYGNHLDRLDSQAQQVAKLLNEVHGATDVSVQSPPGTPQIGIRLRQPDLERWGFAAVDVLDAIRTAYQGDVVGQVYEGNRVFDVAVVLDLEARKQIAAIGDLPLRNPLGTYVPLSQLADIYETSGRYVVLHQGARRVQTVTCNVAGRDVGSFVAEAKRKIDSLGFPSGSYVEFSGAAEAQAKSQQDLLIRSAIAGIGVVLLLSILISNSRNLLLVLLNLPFALVGGVLAVFFTGGWLTLGSLVGFVTLFGITLRNSIILIAHYEHLVAEEGKIWNWGTALLGAQQRLTPILMTALDTALGLLPLAIGSGDPGREIEGPMAIVILGGLLTSTALNLLVLPALAVRYGRFTADREDTHA